MDEGNKLPVALIIDDANPCVNLLYYAQQMRGESPTVPRTVSFSLLEELAGCVERTGARGCMSVVPYPAGLGPISGEIPGFDRRRVADWNELARRRIMPQFDIHPEILTHTHAMSLQNNELLDVREDHWTLRQPEGTLAAYFARAMCILRDAGLPSNGITQPWSFEGDEQLYARALLCAEEDVNGRSVTHYFIHTRSEGYDISPTVTWERSESAGAAVSIVSGTEDVLWTTMDAEKPSPAGGLADYYVTEDGKGGRLVDLVRHGQPAVFHTHWQSLDSGGTHAGMRALEIVFDRINEHLCAEARWMKLSEIAGLTAQSAVTSP